MRRSALAYPATLQALRKIPSCKEVSCVLPFIHCLSCCLVILLMSYPGRSHSAAADDDAQWKQALAYFTQANIWRSPAWLRLLHYPDDHPSAVSRVDGGHFFLAANGRQDPRAEGEASLAALLYPISEQQALTCTYPARAIFLSEQLSRLHIKIPTMDCPTLTKWMEALSPIGITLIFPEAYLNNPASMFGHSFLRIESQHVQNPLLAPSVGFAAEVADDDRDFYALRGIFGGYEAGFTLDTYGNTVKRYGAIENRDIWEYRLRLSRQQSQFLVYHLYELLRAKYEYYFFDENCSSQLLSLIEVVQPDLALSSQFSTWVVPVDTIRVLDAQGLIASAHFRPSRRSIIQTAEASLNARQRKLARQLCNQPLDRVDVSSQSSKDKAILYELAAECVQYQAVSRDGKEDLASNRYDQLLNKRNRLDADSTLATLRFHRKRPDQGHSSARISTSIGRVEETDFVDFSYRPVIHSLDDFSEAYAPGAQVEILKIVLRNLSERKHTRLQALSFVDILSAPTRSTLIQPYAWRIRFAAERKPVTPSKQALVYEAKVGWGASSAVVPGWLVYSLVSAEVSYPESQAHGIALAPEWLLGINASQWKRALLQLQWEYTPRTTERKDPVKHLQLHLGWKLTDSAKLFAEFREEKVFRQLSHTGSVGFSIYF